MFSTRVQLHSHTSTDEAAEPAAYRDTIGTQFINRDLSLVEFFRRVLDQAFDEAQPLLERLKFVSILSSNLDEFFMIRVAGLKDAHPDEKVGPDGMSASEVLAEVRQRVLELTAQQDECLRTDILPKLAENAISVCTYASLSAIERGSLDNYFHSNVLPVVTPQAVDPSHPFPYISGGSMNIGVRVAPKLNRRVAAALNNTGHELFMRIKIPQFVPRFIRVSDERDVFVLAEDLIAANIHHLIPEAEPEICHAFRITRDADLELRESEAADLLAMMEDNLRQREFGKAVRLEVADSMPVEMVSYLTGSIGVSDDDVYTSGGPLGLTDLSYIYDLDRPDLKDLPLVEYLPAELSGDESIFDVIRRGDVLLHHPFMPYTIITDLIQTAAEDPDVLAIKICLYRMGPDSTIPPALIEASRRGKQVTVVIELKARFDEANNIEWAKQLEQEGVHVVYGMLGLKTHAKTTLIVRREGEKMVRYVHLATGNYNPQTSAVYTDLGLLTVDEDIADDATELFNFLTAYSQRNDYKKLLVAPINLREEMLALIRREAENARQGLPARIFAKINRLADAEVVEALYDASSAGVQIELVVRGICTLRPGVQGMSENITVKSVVGRFLEHSRVYYFENGGKEEIYMGSSDCMPRNLDRRIEVLTPVSDPKIKRFLRDVFIPGYSKDNARSACLGPDGRYSPCRPDGDEEIFDAQLSFQCRSNVINFNAHN